MCYDFSKFRKKHGFTLVELIVVLVILAILAVLLIPALTGYIGKAKEKKYIVQAKNVMTAAQSKLDELYGEGVSLTVENPSSSGNVGTVTGTIPGLKSVDGTKTPSGYTCAAANDSTYNIFLQGTQLEADIWSLADISSDEEPDLCLLGLGKSTIYLDENSANYDPRKAYTVYFIMYWQDVDDEDSVIYWDGMEWTTKFKWNRKKGAPFKVRNEDEEVYIQLYMLNFFDNNNITDSSKTVGNTGMTPWALIKSLPEP